LQPTVKNSRQTPQFKVALLIGREFVGYCGGFVNAFNEASPDKPFSNTKSMKDMKERGKQHGWTGWAGSKTKRRRSWLMPVENSGRDVGAGCLKEFGHGFHGFIFYPAYPAYPRPFPSSCFSCLSWFSVSNPVHPVRPCLFSLHCFMFFVFNNMYSRFFSIHKPRTTCG
jgi:hypothetical protein